MGALDTARAAWAWLRWSASFFLGPYSSIPSTSGPTTKTCVFGFLLVPTAAWLAWQRRADLLRSSSQPGTRGALALVLISIAAYLVFQRVAARTPAALAAGLLVWSCVWYLWGTRTAVLLAFPVGLVTYGLALQQTLIAPIAFALQGFTAVSAERIGDLLGLNLVREGLVIRGDSYAFVVAEACSGMNSLLALVGLAGVWAYMVRGRLVSRLAIIASGAPPDGVRQYHTRGSGCCW